jgi:hypothetical protein
LGCCGVIGWVSGTISATGSSRMRLDVSAGSAAVDSGGERKTTKCHSQRHGVSGESLGVVTAARHAFSTLAHPVRHMDGRKVSALASVAAASRAASVGR